MISRYVLAVLMAAAACVASAQSDYPRKNIRLVVPSAPGGGTDLIARLFAQKMSEAWGNAVVVDNQSGGATTIGTNLVAKATPDGYTLLMTTANFAFVAALYPKLPYDPQRDFAPIAVTVTQTDCLAVNPQLPARSVAELLALAKAGRDLRYGSGGSGSVGHFAMELFRALAHIEVTHVPYKGHGAASLAHRARATDHCRSGRGGLRVRQLVRAVGAGAHADCHRHEGEC